MIIKIIFRFGVLIMGMIEYANQKMSLAIQTDSFCDFLCGYDNFVIPDRDGFCSTDRGGILYSCIFRTYEKDESISETFSKSLITLLKGNLFEFMTAFDYIQKQKFCEARGSAPFVLDNSCVELLILQLHHRELSLKQYKEHYEFGALLQEGAWEYILNIKKAFIQEYGFDFLK